jgi:aminoglycoside 6-adenylyltransferase
VHTADTTIDRLARWAESRDNVRCLIVTSTRVTPGAHVDAYSDFDVIAVVNNVRSMVDDTTWQAHFGDVLISYWDPLEVDPSTGAEWVSNITNYANGLKIDFNLWSPQHYTHVTVVLTVLVAAGLLWRRPGAFARRQIQLQDAHRVVG